MESESEIDRVRRRIAEEVTACRRESVGHGLRATDLTAHLVVPPRQDRFSDDFGPTRGQAMLWLVLDECPGEDEGYLVVYEASRDEFGLAVKGRGGEPGALVGWYGSLREALEGM